MNTLIDILNFLAMWYGLTLARLDCASKGIKLKHSYWETVAEAWRIIRGNPKWSGMTFEP